MTRRYQVFVEGWQDVIGAMGTPKLRRSGVALLCFWLMCFGFARFSPGQSCLASCPISNSCGNGAQFCGFSPDPYNIGESDHGSDPVYYYANPDPCKYSGFGCSAGMYFDGACCFHQSSPILLDLENEGFHLSDAPQGVQFKIFPNVNRKFQVAWPVPGSHNAWLVLDRNGNGIIDDFGEFFGNETAQPTPKSGEDRNGFLALAVYDRPENGGDGDGWISKKDAVFDKLRVWRDDNHDGISQPDELHTLESVGIAAISLGYTYSKRVDENGNAFRYKSVIRDDKGGETARGIYDVLLNIGATQKGEAKDTKSAWMPIINLVPNSGSDR